MQQLCIAYHFLYACDSSDTGLNVAEHILSGRQSMSGTYKQHTRGLMLVWAAALSQAHVDGRISTLPSSKCMCH